MSLMPKAFVPEKAGDLEAVIEFSLSGRRGNWAVTISEGSCSVSRELAENPKLTLSALASDYLDIITGKVNAMSAFAEGKVKLRPGTSHEVDDLLQTTG
jgi:putative sterol carrier protein